MTTITETPSQIRAIVQQCASPRRALEWFLDRIIDNNRPMCSSCRIPLSVIRINRIPNRWRCSRCRRSFGIFHNTIFDGRRTPFHKVLLLILLLYLQVSQTTIRYLCNVSRPTIMYYQRISRLINLSAFHSEHLSLGGPNMRVQIDEAILQKRKYHRGRKKPQISIFGAIQEGSRQEQRLFLKRVKSRTAATLIPIIKSLIKPETTIVSDEWRAYFSLSEIGYSHKRVNHSRSFVNEEGDNTNLIEGVWAHLRRSLPRTGVKRHLIDEYLARFVMTYNSKRGFINYFQDLTFFNEKNVACLADDSSSVSTSDSGDIFEDLAIPESHSDSHDSAEVDPLGAGTGESSSEYQDEE